MGLSLSHHHQPAPFRNQHTMAFLRLLVTKCWFPSSSKLQESNKSLTERKGSIPHHSGKKTTQNNRVAILKAIPPAFFFSSLKQLPLPKSQSLMSITRATLLSLSLCPDGWTLLQKTDVFDAEVTQYSASIS